MMKKWILPLAALVCLLLPQLALAVGFVFERIADSADPVPGGTGTFTSFELPSADAPDVAFIANGSGGQRGIYARLGAPLGVLYDLTTVPPGGTDPFDDLDHLSLDAGGVAFAGSSPLVTLFTDASGALTAVAEVGVSAPGVGGTLQGIQSLSLDDGVVSFNGELVSGTGVFSGSGGAIAVEADAGTSIAIAYADTVSRSEGRVAFAARKADGADALLIAGNGAIEVVADESTQVPGRTGTFPWFHNTDLDGNDVSFGSSSGVYARIGGTLFRVAGKNTLVPDGSGETFRSFGATSIDRGQVAFVGTSSSKGIYLLREGRLFEVVRVGQRLDGEELQGVAMSNEALSRDRIAFRAKFVGRSGVYVARLVETIGATAIAAGDDHTCRLLTDGSVDCWGRGDEGQLSAPDGSVEEISSGALHSCARRSDGSVECWGDDSAGQATAPSGLFFVRISSGGFHNCGILTDGTLFCWGEDGSPQSTPPPGVSVRVTSGLHHSCALRTDSTGVCWGVETDPSFSTLTVPPGAFTALTAGAFFTCGIRVDGTVTCWGRNDDLESTPPPATGFLEIAAGSAHVCGVTAARKLLCWGSGASGQLNAPSGDYESVTSGAEHSCATRTDGQVVCWGAAGEGQTEVGVAALPRVSAGELHTCVTTPRETLDCFGDATFGQLAAPSGVVVDVSAGLFHSCAPRENGSLECWGDPAFGRTTPPAGSVAQVSSGGDHSCAVRPGGAVVCWGRADSGQLAAPPGDFEQVAAALGPFSCGVRENGFVACWGDAPTPLPGSFTHVVAGFGHVCGLTPSRQVRCWGANDFGQRNAPGGPFVELSAGFEYTCGVRPTGEMRCWGRNDDLQASPFPGRYERVGAGVVHTCAVLEGGAIGCWGDDASGAGVSRADLDGDQVPDVFDNCKLVPNPDQADFDEDGAGDACDVCPLTWDPEQLNYDSDPLGNACDNCDTVSNPPHEKPTDCNLDGDVEDPGEGVGEQCDSDGDGEGDLCRRGRTIVRPLSALGGMGSSPPLLVAHATSANGESIELATQVEPMMQVAGSQGYEVFLDCGAFDISLVELGLVKPSGVADADVDFGIGCQPLAAGACSAAMGIGDTVDPATSFVDGPGLTDGRRSDTSYFTAFGDLGADNLLCTSADTEPRLLAQVAIDTATEVANPALTTEGVTTPFTDLNDVPLDQEDFLFVVGTAASVAEITIGPALGDSTGERWEVTLNSTIPLYRVSWAVHGSSGITPAQMRFIGCGTDPTDPNNLRTCGFDSDPGPHGPGPYVDFTTPGGSFTVGPGAAIPGLEDALFVTVIGNLLFDPAQSPTLNFPGIPVSLGVIEIQGSGGVQPALTLDQLDVALGVTPFVASDPSAPAVDPGTVTAIGGFQPPDDFDGDTRNDDVDNCPFAANFDQLDRGTLLLLESDNIGDACQCGEGIGNQAILDEDADSLQELLADRVNDPALREVLIGRCSVAGGPACTALDWAVLKRALNGLAPGIAPACEKALR